MRLSFFLAAALIITGCLERNGIDRYALVNRHNIEITKPDSLNSLSVGNGAFAFTVDITGLQTFPEFYSKGVPLGTMSEWGWHSEPNTRDFRLSDVFRRYNVNGREIDYVHMYSDPSDSVRTGASEYLRRNPYRLHLGTIGLDFPDVDDSQAGMIFICEPKQKLDLWKGEIQSGFIFADTPVQVSTVCHPERDMISARIVSGLVGQKKLRVKIDLTKGNSSSSGFGFNYPENQRILLLSENERAAVLKREMDQDSYYITIYKEESKLVRESETLWFLEARSGESVLEFSCLFSNEAPAAGEYYSFSDAVEASSEAWKKFWLSGGAVDFEGSTDPRAVELERRVILSQYLTRLQSAGTFPPAETGLTYNSWYGKFHLEMHWWHSAHFAMWGREEILEKQLDYYFRIYDKAHQTASRQGYDGVRWPKMTDPEGNESPSSVGPYLIWQQPHIIYFAELLYQVSDNKDAVLGKYRELVSSTAGFMASYAWFDSTNNCYSLGPVLISAQETLKAESTINPSFELAYWYWGLKTAEKWRKRLGYKIETGWEMTADRLAPLQVKEGLYLCSYDTKDTWTNPRYTRDHPIIAGSYGMIPETGIIDTEILTATLDTIQNRWNWKSCWGWDYPLLAMSAAALNRPEQAVDFLMMDAPKNRYLVNGHNYQDARLSIYLPGNGGILSAVAMMCTSDRFPKNGKWNVKWENLNRID
jgi:hypothetical protein